MQYTSAASVVTLRLKQWTGQTAVKIKARSSKSVFLTALVLSSFLSGPLTVLLSILDFGTGKYSALLNYIIIIAAFAIGCYRQKSREWVAVGTGVGLFLVLGVFAPMVGSSSLGKGAIYSAQGMLAFLAGWASSNTFRLGYVHVSRYCKFVIGWKFNRNAERLHMAIRGLSTKHSTAYRKLRAQEKGLWRAASDTKLWSYSHYRAVTLRMPFDDVYRDTLRLRKKRSE